MKPVVFYLNGRRFKWEYFNHDRVIAYLLFVKYPGNFIIAAGRRCNDVASMQAFCDQQKRPTCSGQSGSEGGK